jgi:CheY-like chemotaxis protein
MRLPRRPRPKATKGALRAADLHVRARLRATFETFFGLRVVEPGTLATLAGHRTSHHRTSTATLSHGHRRGLRLPNLRCTCGTPYTDEEWRALPRAGNVDVEGDHASVDEGLRFAAFELRTCPVCHSTLSSLGGPTSGSDRQIPNAPLSAPRALVVDDDSAVARATTRALLTIGFLAVTSLSGAHALERVLRGERFELIVSDVRMPGLSGPGFHLAARSSWPEIDAVLVYMSGAYPAPSLTARCFRKPVEADFFTHVRSVLERWQRRS